MYVIRAPSPVGSSETSSVDRARTPVGREHDAARRLEIGHHVVEAVPLAAEHGDHFEL